MMETKIVYQTDDRGVYIAPVTLDESDISPLEPETWLIPGGCVEIEPPETPEGKLTLYNGAGWDLIDEPSPEVEPEPEPEPEPSPDDIRRQLTEAVQTHMNTVAQERNYDSILSLCTYATSTNQNFAAEGQAGVEWRDSVWVHCYELLDKVEAGEAAIPTVAELIEVLPSMAWPHTEGSTPTQAGPDQEVVHGDPTEPA